jgi:hypothetical protein
MHITDHRLQAPLASEMQAHPHITLDSLSSFVIPVKTQGRFDLLLPVTCKLGQPRELANLHDATDLSSMGSQFAQIKETGKHPR